MKGNGKLLTIPEAAGLAGISESGLYKHIRKGSVPVQELPERGRLIKKVEKEDVIRFFNISVQDSPGESRTQTELLQDESRTIQESSGQVQELTGHLQKLTEYFQESFQEFRKDQTTQLMPVNQNISYIARTLMTENQILKRKIEEMEEKHNRELAELQKKQEAEKEEIAKAWKQKVEDLEKPWWKKFF